MLAFFPVSAQAVPAKIISEAVEFVLKKSGKATSPATKLAMENALKAATTKHGDDVLAYVRSGGAKAIAQGEKYGDEFWALCRQYPDSCAILANNADDLIPLVRKSGTEVVAIEAKAPGLTRDLVDFYGDSAVKTLAKSSPDELAKLYSVSKNNPGQALQIFEQHRSSPGFLHKFSGTQLAGLGVGGGMLAGGVGTGVAAHEVGDGIQDGLKTVSKESPQTFSTLVAILFAIGVTMLFVVLKKFLPRITEKKKSPENNQ